MILVRRSLAGRAFSLQFNEIMAEFGNLIPWLRAVRPLKYATNGAYFKQELRRSLGCEEIVPYQLTTADRSHEFVGGILHFPVSPENFQDRHNKQISATLSNDGAHYITCLQVREVMRGAGHGQDTMERVVRSILKTHPKVWAVCEPELVPWYQSFGAQVLNTKENKDNLSIIAWRA